MKQNKFNPHIIGFLSVQYVTFYMRHVYLTGSTRGISIYRCHLIIIEIPTVQMLLLRSESYHNILCWWWRHQMETFSALLAICVGNSPVPGEFPSQRQVTRNFDVFFDLRLNKLLSNQSWGWWFETPLRPLWHHDNVVYFKMNLTNTIL